MKTETGITILSNDRWYFQGAEIINDRVLSYFRANLRVDQGRLFIHNSFQGKEENGYLERVEGFPLHALHAFPRDFQVELSLDSGIEIALPYDDILLLDPTTLAFYTPEGIPGRFSSTAMTLIGGVLAEENGSYFWDTASGRVPVSEMTREDFFALVRRNDA